MRTAQTIFAIALLCAIGFTSAIAQNETPHDYVAYWVEPYAGDLSVQLLTFGSVMSRQGYIVELRLFDYTNGPYQFSQLDQDISWGCAAWGFNSHGSTSGCSIPSWPHTEEGRAARNTAYDDLIRAGKQDGIDIYESESAGGYSISVTAAYLAAHFRSNQGIVFSGACSGHVYASSWNARCVFDYAACVLSGTVRRDCDSLFIRMDGQRGLDNRSAFFAVNGTSLSSSGNLFTVLSPAVVDISVPPNTVFHNTATVTVTFDALMDTGVSPMSVMTVDGLRFLVRNPRWVNGTQLAAELQPQYSGTDSLRLVATDPDHGIYNGLVSAGGIPLDGDGVGPNRHDKTRPFISAVDNPAASIAWFRPIGQPDGVHVEWKVESQDSTDHYLVVRSDSRFGPFTTIAAVPVDTTRTEYAIVDWGRTDGFYRLLEVETNGDTLVQGFDGVNDPVVLTPDPEASPAVADSINSAMLVQYPPTAHVEQIQPIWGITYITKAAWMSRLDARVNKLANQGYEVNVLSIESFGSTKSAQRDAINAYISQCIPYGLWAVCLVGDNEDSEAWDSFPWYDWSKQPWPSEAWADVIPTFYLPDVSHLQAKSQSWYTPYLNTDQLYGAGPDSLPRVTITRIPARNADEVTYACAKADAYESLDLSRGTYAFFVQDLDLNGCSGQVAMDQARSAMAKVPSQYTVKLVADSLGTSYTYAQRQSMFVSTMSPTDPTNRVVAAEFHGAMSNRNQIWWYQYSLGGRWSLLPQYAGICVVLAPWCEVAGTSRRIDPTAARGYMELASTVYPDRGPALIIGALCGTDQVVNGMLTDVFHDILKTSGARSGPEAWTMTTQIVGRMFPGNERVLHAILSTGVIGFPESPWPGMVIRTTWVNNLHGVSRVYFAPCMPNPSRGTVTFGFALPTAGSVQLNVYDVTGRLVRTVVDNTALSPGGHSYTWDRTNNDGQLVNAGVYFARLVACGQKQKQKVVILR